MKKLSAIFLLAIFAFNTLGYQLVYNYFFSTANATLTVWLDANNYKDEDLISVKLAVQIPYYNNSKDFARIDGEVEIDGVTYRYVKSRIYHDTLEMLCTPNRAKMDLERAKNEYAKKAYDFSNDNTQKKKNGKDAKHIQKQLNEFETVQTLATKSSFHFSAYHPIFNTVLLYQHFYNIIVPPPDVSALS